MTVTKDTPHLRLFKSKIDEAVSYVPKMPTSEKLRAVQFWNVVSEKLQVIVNSCAADMNAISVKTQEDEAEKIPLEMSHPSSMDLIPNSCISSDFMNLSSSYGNINNSGHAVDGSNTQFLVPEATFSVSNVPLINNSGSSSEKTMSDSYITLESLAHCSCDTLGIDSRTYESKETPDQVCQLPEGTKEISNILCQSNTSHELSENQKSCTIQEDFPIVRKKFKSKSNCDNVSDVDENSLNSVKSDLNSGDSDSSHVEPIVSFVVSSSEEILAKNGLTPELEESGSSLGDNKQPKSYKCSICPARFSARGNLIVHMRRHTGEKPYSCARCAARFTTKGNLKRHMKTHTGEKPYQCTSCGGKFTEKKSLIVHMRRHTGEKPYQCRECGKRFGQSSILQTHMAMHLNQKFHLCEHCGKSFRQRSQLQTHKLRHTNVRKYGCSSCSSRFLTKGDLERHTRTHTGERPYVCKVCSKAYTRQQSLNEHLNRHYGIRPYSCKYCSRAFTEMSACYKHIKQHEKADRNGSKLLSNEVEESPLCEKLQSSESEVSRNQNAITHQSLASFIENFFP